MALIVCLFAWEWYCTSLQDMITNCLHSERGCHDILSGFTVHLFESSPCRQKCIWRALFHSQKCSLYSLYWLTIWKQKMCEWLSLAVFAEFELLGISMTYNHANMAEMNSLNLTFKQHHCGNLTFKQHHSGNLMFKQHHRMNLTFKQPCSENLTFK